MYNKRYSLALKTGCFLLLLVALVTGVAGGFVFLQILG